MTPNARAKIPAQMILTAGFPLVVFHPPFDGMLIAVPMLITVVFHLVVAGGRDLNPGRSVIDGGAPAYWVPAAMWLATLGLAPFPEIEAVKWLVLAAGTIGALADFGSRQKNY